MIILNISHLTYVCQYKLLRPISNLVTSMYSTDIALSTTIHIDHRDIIYTYNISLKHLYLSQYRSKCNEIKGEFEVFFIPHLSVDSELVEM